jgi:hypothetical protein
MKHRIFPQASALKIFMMISEFQPSLIAPQGLIIGEATAFLNGTVHSSIADHIFIFVFSVIRV